MVVKLEVDPDFLFRKTLSPNQTNLEVDPDFLFKRTLSPNQTNLEGDPDFLLKEKPNQQIQDPKQIPVDFDFLFKKKT